MSGSESFAGDKVSVEVTRRGVNSPMEEEQMKMKGLYTIEVVRQGLVVYKREYPNIITQQGRRYILQTALTGGTNLDYASVATIYTAKSAFYVFLTETSGAPTDGQVYRNDVPLILTEYQGQSESSLPRWNGVLDGTTSMMTNTALKALFTVNTAGTIQGAGMVSVGTKGTLGQLFATAQNVLVSYSTFGSPIAVTTNDVINVTIALSLT